ncbi:protein PHOX1 [Cajanus cajan]|uniref:protein PHOX1 n=1 Tax=Cajanus cajan TaxID=3821 RepID=UPI00098DB052|nr:protein PHOX1 [Cajanus cajan]XP_020226482.1 protein PHOX1 [Cajanus cajan]
MGKKKKQVGEIREDGKVGDSGPGAYDNDTMVFISMSQELKNEGNKLFQKRDLEGALLKYEKALKLLPKNHIDVSYLRSNMAACYMQMGLSEFPRAIHECDLALEVTPKYSKALLKRARCYEALNRLDLALRDVTTVVKMEPNNLMALEILEKVKNVLEEKGLRVDDTIIELSPDYVEPPNALPPEKVLKEKTRKKKANREEEKAPDEKILEKQTEEKFEEKKAEGGGSVIVVEKKINASKKKKAKEKIDEKKAEIKEVIEERSNGRREDVPKKTAKLIFGDDIRCTEIPFNCSLFQLREVIYDRFPSLGAVLVKYRDQEGDLVTITSDDELRWAETESHGSMRLYIVEATPEQDLLFEKLKVKVGKMVSINGASENGCVGKAKEIVGSSCIEDWIIQFAKLFKNHVGFESDRYLDFHELGMKLYSEALEETVTSEEAQGLFDMAGDKFQEMTALALFNWGNVHMSRARKKVYFREDSSKEQLCEQIKSSYEWALEEYSKAGEKYEAAIKIKSDFHEGFLALGLQQFEQAKLSWYHALSGNVDLLTWPSTEVLHLYNNAEENMEKGMQMWEESEKQNLSKTFESNDVKVHLQNTGLDGILKNVSLDELAAQETHMRSQINLLWGTMLYERSIVEFKLGLPIWHESLEVAINKFELAGASPTDIAVILKNHCSNDTAVDGLAFKIDEIVQAWNEMYKAKKWQGGVPSFRLEPLFRRRVSKIYHAFELA